MSDDDEGYHPYLQILAMCLLNQGNGVSEYLRRLNSHDDAEEVLNQIREYAAEADFTLVGAVIYSANWYKTEIKSSEFECIWELIFGTDWREYRQDVIFIWKKLPLIRLEANPSAKALFYASLLLPFYQNYDLNLTMLASKLKPHMLIDFPALNNFLMLLRNQSSFPFDFPYLFLLRGNPRIILQYTD